MANKAELTIINTQNKLFEFEMPSYDPEFFIEKGKDIINNPHFKKTPKNLNENNLYLVVEQESSSPKFQYHVIEHLSNSVVCTYLFEQIQNVIKRCKDLQVMIGAIEKSDFGKELLPEMKEEYQEISTIHVLPILKEFSALSYNQHGIPQNIPGVKRPDTPKTIDCECGNTIGKVAYSLYECA